MAAGEKTESATPRHRRRAREKGQFAYSQELAAAMALASGTAVTFYVLGSPAGFQSYLHSIVRTAMTRPASDEVFLDLIRQSGSFFMGIVTPVLAAATIGGLAGNVIQGLPIYAPEKAGFKWERLNPVEGLSRLKAKLSLMEWARLLLLVGVITWVLWTTFSIYWQQLVSAPLAGVESSTALIRAMTLRIVSFVVLAVGILAIADYYIQRWRFEKSIKQTKAEVKEDMKEMEGNPAIRNKIRAIQRERARRRMMARVKDADVIVTNPTEYAVALEYKPAKMSAPRVVAKGRDWLAEKIRQLGRDYDIPAVENVPLARALYRSVELEQEIPLSLYKAVAEVLAYVYRIRKPK